MTVTANVYGNGVKNIYNGTVNLVTNTIKVALMKTNFSWNANDENFVNTHECDSTDYTPGGVTLPIVTDDINFAANVMTVDTSALIDSVKKTRFTAEGDIKAQYAVIYSDTTDPKKLLGFVDFGGEKESINGEFSLVWHDDGIFSVTVNP